MPSGKQDAAFGKLMSEDIDEIKMSGSALDDAIQWIADNLQPEDVFSEHALELWAQSKEPENLFTSIQLGYWAEANGYTKE